MSEQATNVPAPAVPAPAPKFRMGQEVPYRGAGGRKFTVVAMRLKPQWDEDSENSPNVYDQPEGGWEYLLAYWRRDCHGQWLWEHWGWVLEARVEADIAYYASLEE